MNRRDSLRLIGLGGAASILPFSLLKADDDTQGSARSCVLIPTETAGPFPLDLTENTTYFRQDLVEDRTGVPLNVKLKIVGLSNCLPMQNVRVNIWHCDKDGLYSGYDVSNNAGQAGKTYLRGYQMTDADGEVEFSTIFPGWYNGRICHIHFQVYVSTSYSAISQMTFDVDTKNAIYAANSSLYTKGSDPMSLASDNIFSDGYAYQMATLTENSNTGGYDAYIEVTVQGEGVLGLGNAEKLAAKQLTLGQNFPNPFSTNTTVPFSITQSSRVILELYGLQGNLLTTIVDEELIPGDYNIEIPFESLGIKPQSSLYQLRVINDSGMFVDGKLMTSIK